MHVVSVEIIMIILRIVRAASVAVARSRELHVHWLVLKVLRLDVILWRAVNTRTLGHQVAVAQAVVMEV